MYIQLGGCREELVVATRLNAALHGILVLRRILCMPLLEEYADTLGFETRRPIKVLEL